MTEEDVLIEVIRLLDKLTIPYALTGGLAVSFYGQPRSTHDFDLVIHIPDQAKTTKKLLAAFTKDYYISEEGIIDALLHKTLFNIIHHETGLKIDFWIMKADEYNKEAFERRKKRKALGTLIWVLSPEDMIINKLLWFKNSDMEKHFKDAKSIYDAQKIKLDFKYLLKWSIKLSINKILKEISG